MNFVDTKSTRDLRLGTFDSVLRALDRYVLLLIYANALPKQESVYEVSRVPRLTLLTAPVLAGVQRLQWQDSSHASLAVNPTRNDEIKKHCKIFVSCSAREVRTTDCKLTDLNTSYWNYMQAHGTVCKLMELHSRSWSSMQAHGTAWNWNLW